MREGKRLGEEVTLADNWLLRRHNDMRGSHFMSIDGKATGRIVLDIHHAAVLVDVYLAVQQCCEPLQVAEGIKLPLRREPQCSSRLNGGDDFMHDRSVDPGGAGGFFF